jgi:hypothetical protein
VSENDTKLNTRPGAHVICPLCGNPVLMTMNQTSVDVWSRPVICPHCRSAYAIEIRMLTRGTWPKSAHPKDVPGPDAGPPSLVDVGNTSATTGSVQGQGT